MWRWTGWCSGGYLAALLVAWALLFLVAEHWWLSALLLFGPRWVLAVPLAALLPAAAVCRRTMLAPLFLAAAVLGGPILGFCVPTARLFRPPRPLARVRVLTCNTDGDNLHPRDLRLLLAETGPDVVALQEWQERFNTRVFADGRWYVHPGNGIALASRYPIRGAYSVTDAPGWRDVITRFDLKTPDGPLTFFAVHLATPRSGLEEVMHRGWRGEAEQEANNAQRDQESAAAGHLVAQAGGAFLVAGDFNMPCDSAIYRQYWGRFADAFSSAGVGLGHSKFTRWWGVRIDHILAGPGWRCRRCWVGPDVGSDHRPVIADMDWYGLPEQE
ncbi:MAG TPA: endonuclease/exonuclease/phosphatase family protein [Gemmataceae bacterium]|nr:endonuclease/exonuclease/phosphatase family protein [Gemmataceae bacterium]